MAARQLRVQLSPGRVADRRCRLVASTNQRREDSVGIEEGGEAAIRVDGRDVVETGAKRSRQLKAEVPIGLLTERPDVSLIEVDRRPDNQRPAGDLEDRLVLLAALG